MPENPASFAAAGEIRALLARRRLNQTELARGTGIPIDRIRSRLRGEVSFRLEELDAIAAFLDVPTTALLVGAA